MNTLPIVTRELIVRARMPQMHWTRMAFAALAVFVSLQFFLLWRGMDLTQIGSFAFQTLSWMAFLLTSAGFVLTADSISSERRRGTLGLLFLTRIATHDVLIGKLVSAGLSALLGLVAVTPVLMLPVLAGGVRWEQVVLVALSFPSLLFFTLCAGLWASSNSSWMGQSFLRAVLAVVLIVKIPLILSALMIGAESIRSISPGGAFLWGVAGTKTLGHAGYWWSVAAGYFWGGLFLVMGARKLKASLQEETDPVVGAPSSTPTAGRPPLGDQPPLRWLLRRSTVPARLLWLAAALLMLPETASALLPALQSGGAGMSLALSWLTSLAAGVVLSAAGAMFFLDGRRTGALELLRTTPAGHQELLTDQFRVMRERLTKPVILVAVATLVLAVISSIRTLRATPALSFTAPQTIGGLVSTVFDMVALCWLGMWFGYRARTPWSALLWPVGLVTGLNMVLLYTTWGVISLLLSTVAYRIGSGWYGLAWLILALPWVLAVVKQVWLIRWARRRLHESFAGASFQPMELRATASLTARRVVAALRKARHWTPGGDR